MGKTSISVPEMQRLLGMKKVEAYWLVKQSIPLQKGQRAGTRPTTPCVSDRPGGG